MNKIEHSELRFLRRFLINEYLGAKKLWIIKLIVRSLEVKYYGFELKAY